MSIAAPAGWNPAVTAPHDDGWAVSVTSTDVAGEGCAGVAVAEWDALASSMRFPTPFATWAWHAAGASAFAQVARARVLVVRERGQLRALLPLSVQRSSIVPGLGGELGYAGALASGADHVDLICTPEHLPASVAAIGRFLRDRSRTDGLVWHTLRLPLVAEDSALLRLAPDELGASHRAVAITVAPWLPVAGDFDVFLKSLGGKARQQLRARLRKLLDEQGASYVEFRRAEFETALARLLELHAQRARVKGLASAFTGPAVEAFHRALLARLPDDQVMLRGLRHGIETIAMFYGFIVAGRMFYFQLGFDPRWSAHSPGLVLLTCTIREAFERGLGEYNFLQGAEPFKRTWASHERSLHDLYLFSDTLSGRALDRLHRLRLHLASWRRPRGP